MNIHRVRFVFARFANRFNPFAERSKVFNQNIRIFGKKKTMKIIVILLLFISYSSKAQEVRVIEEVDSHLKNVIPGYEFTIETGVNSRGLIGLSLGKNFKNVSSGYTNLSASAGFGLYWEDAYIVPEPVPSFIASLSPSYNMGEGSSYLTIGGELKYMYCQPNYEGSGLGGFLGYAYNGPSGFLFKVRCGATKWFDLPEDGPGFDLLGSKLPVGMFGMSFGYGFN